MANFDYIKLEKGLYASGNFTAALESVDKDENYKGTSLEGLDAYQRQLKRYGIKVSGENSDCIAKFFSTSDSAVLFPEFVSRAVRQGMNENDVLSSIVATTSSIDSNDYRSITSSLSADDKELKLVGEGAFIPETSVKTKDNLVSLKKRGRSLVASYEAVKYQRLDLFALTLRQIGAYISHTLLEDAIEVLKNGDGNSNAAPTVNTATAGTLAYGDLVSLWTGFDPYKMNTIIASPDMTSAILNMSQFRDAAAGLDFHGSGKLVTPFGAQLINTSAMQSGKLIGFDKNASLEMVKAGDVMTEYDKLIDRQLDRAVISCTVGFAKMFKDAGKVLSI